MLGSKKYAPWLYVYTAFNQEFKEGWIPDNYYGKVVVPKTNNHLGSLANVKTLTNKLIETDLLPYEVYKVNNNFYDNSYNHIPLQKLENYLFSRNDKYYVKRDDSNQGRGVFIIRKDQFDINELLEIDNCVIQEPITQSNWFSDITDLEGVTIRITTVRTNSNKIQTRAGTLRVGIEESEIVKHYDSIRVPISVKDRALGSFGTDSFWKKYKEHPKSGYIFEGKKLPAFDHVKKELESLHEKFIHYSVIGWDISIDKENKPKIIEWNASHPGIKFHEAFIGPCFTGLEWENLWK